MHFGNTKEDNTNIPYSGEIKSATAIINFEDVPEPNGETNSVKSSLGLIFSIDEKIHIGVDKSRFLYIHPISGNTVTNIGEINDLEEITEFPQKMGNSASFFALLHNGYILKIGSMYARLYISDWSTYHEITKTNLIARHIITVRYQYPWNP